MMSKPNKVRHKLTFAWLLSLCVLLNAVTGIAQTRRQPAPRPSRKPPLDVTAAPPVSNAATVAALTASVLQETAEIRELPILRPVQSGVQTRAQIEAWVLKNLNEEATPDDFHADEAMLKRLGLVPPDFNLRDFYVKVLTEQVAGFYEPKTQTFYLTEGTSIERQRAVMAHELTHALQDQHYNLRRFQNWQKGDTDAELAAHALIEGDAMLVMSFYIRRNPLRLLNFARSAALEDGNSQTLNAAPRIIRETLLFPYLAGLTWTTEAHKRGGWAAISGAYTTLPASTEQILHPEKYFAAEAPVKIALPDLRPQFGAGWKLLKTDISGELGTSLILGEYLHADATVKQAAAGWGGDRYGIYENARTGQVCFAQKSAWDTEQDAIEFFNAYVERTKARYPQATQVKTTPTVYLEWRNTDGSKIILERRAAEVTILEGVSANTDATALSAALWR